MGTVIGDLLPFALGIAISPMPIIVVILTLLSPRAPASSAGFLAGWVVGVLVVVVVLTALSGLLPDAPGAEPGFPAGAIKLVLGALLLWLAAAQWRKRSRGKETELPSWMQKVGGMGFGGTSRLGLLLSIANPKNLIFSLSVAVDVGTSGLDTTGAAVALVVFVLLAASTVLLPVVAYAFAAQRLRPALTGLRAWLSRENHTIMCVLFLVLGVSAIGSGLGIVWR